MNSTNFKGTYGNFTDIEVARNVNATNVYATTLVALNSLQAGLITYAGGINMSASGDLDDYISFATVGNIPEQSIIGGYEFHLKTNEATFPTFRLQNVSGINSLQISGYEPVTFTTTAGIKLVSGGNSDFDLDGDGGTGDFYVRAGDDFTLTVGTSSVAKINIKASAPTCAAGNAGAVYADSTSPATFCVCNSTSWVNLGPAGSCV